MILRKTILNISFLLLPLSILAQNAGYVKLSGQVKLRGSNNELKDVSLVIFSGGEKVNEIKTNSSETFQIRLEFNKKYLVEVNKAGLVKLKYEIVTQLPESEFNKIHPFYLRVYLFPNYPEMDMSIYGGLSSTIKYDKSSGKFAFNYTGSENLHQRIVENDRVILGVTKQKLQVFENAKTEGNRAYDDKLFKVALSEYSKASGLFPKESASLFVDNQYITNRIRMCDKMVAEAKLNQGEYNNTITVADKLFDAKEYERARVSYQKAQSLRPGATRPTERLREIGKFIADNKVQNVLYDVAFESAMKWLELKDYEKALGDFEQASLIKPDEALPKRKIDELKKILAEIKAKHESYDKLIVQADNTFNAKKYKEARLVYLEALKIFPDEKYPQNRINDIDIILEQLDSQSEQRKIYDGLIAGADAMFNDYKYNDAKIKYQEAIKVRPAEEYPKNRIAEIDGIISKISAQQKAYEEAIENADTYFNSADYTNAIGQYNIALGHKPDEEYPKNKIAEIDNILAEQVFQKAKDKNYAEAIKLADSSFELNDLAQARTHYQKASEIKAEEDYPKGKISEIDKILAERKSVNDSFDRAIANADRLFEAEDYGKSKSSFEEALQIKAEENYPKEKIAKIESILAKLNIQQQAYDKLIAEADGYFTATKYGQSKQAYQEALNVKPNEAYPADRIKEIDNMLADEKSKQESYDAAIALGDSQFNGKEYSKAKDSYNTASGLKPDEKYPKDKLNEIAILLTGILAQEEAYAKAITDADEKFNANIFDESLKSYQQALKIKPAEAYPGERIGEINKILADIKAKEEAYSEAISMGDKSFKSKEYLQAKDFYLKATEFKPDQNYTKEKLREIEKILAAERSQQESYDNAIANADKLFVAKDYEKSRPEYESALTFKPKETYPNEKIEEIDNIIADIKAKQEAYDKAIALGDEKFAANDLVKSKESYQEALSVKPNEAYPADKIREIENILADEKAKQESYDAAIASGDSQFNSKEYSKAKESYNTASGIKPKEQYPKDKLNEIAILLAGILAQEEAYAKAITDADQKFIARNYKSSRESYEEAQKIKSNEKYPGERVAEIDKILAEIKAKQEKYDNFIANADAHFNAKEHEDAIREYKKASEVLSAEEYPKNKIKEIEQILADLKEKKDLYKNAISSADQKFNSKKYIEAKADYQKALDVKPSEGYPAAQITEIDDILTEIKRINDAFDNAVSAGASLFKAKEYEDARERYQKAAEIKPDEQFVKDKIIEINNILLADQEARQEAYDKAIATADEYANVKDFKNALKEYENASNIKTSEQYPKRKISEIKSIFKEEARLLRVKYDKIIVDADKLYETRVLDLAIFKYKQALLILPDEKYPRQKIDEITRYIIDNAIVDVNKETMLIQAKSEKKFAFEPVDIRARKSAYIFLKIKNLSNKPSKLFLNYGKDATKSGGITFALEEDDVIQNYIIRVSVQDKWFRIDNNWLSIYPQGGDVEVSSIRISKVE